MLVLRGEFGLAKKPRPTSGCPSVNHVKPKDEAVADLVHSTFQKISECDVVMALKKPDGTLGEGVTYEVEFATWLKKPVIYVSSTGCKCISSEKSHLGKDESGPSDKKNIQLLSI